MSGEFEAADTAGPRLEWSPRHALDAAAVTGIESWLGTPECARAEVPSANGCFTARSLARLYAALAEGGELDGVRLLSAETLRRATTPQNDRPDLVLGVPPIWRLGWHAAYTTVGLVPDGFAHHGFGGSGAWADPARRLAVAFTTNLLGAGGALGDTRLPELGATILAAADLRG